jgi:hypothetical protein
MAMVMVVMPDRHERSRDAGIAAHCSKLGCGGCYCCVTVDQNGAVRMVHVSTYPFGGCYPGHAVTIHLSNRSNLLHSLVVPSLPTRKTVTMSLKDIDDVEKSAGSDFTSPAATICAAGLGAVELTELQKTRGICSP